MTREDKFAMFAMAAIFVIAIAWGASAGAFSGKPKAPEVPTPTPTPTPEPAEPVVRLPVPVPPTFDAPEWLLEGGAPPSGREHLAWYSYRGMWIRVEGEHDIDSAPASTGHQNPHGYIWWSVYQDSTPLASERAWNEPASFSEDPDALLPVASNIDAAAKKGAAWVDMIKGGAAVA